MRTMILITMYFSLETMEAKIWEHIYRMLLLVTAEYTLFLNAHRYSKIDHIPDHYKIFNKFKRI